MKKASKRAYAVIRYIVKHRPMVHQLMKQFGFKLNDANYILGLAAGMFGPGGRGEDAYARSIQRVFDADPLLRSTATRRDPSKKSKTKPVNERFRKAAIHADVMRGLSAPTPKYRSARTRGHRKLEFEIISLDVWGNQEDGFQVNDQFRTGRVIEVECRESVHNVGTEGEFTSCDPTDRAIIAALVNEGFFKRGVTSKDVTIDGESDYTLYLEDAKTGEPVVHLERIK